MINKLKNKWVILIGIFIVVGYIVTLIFRVLTPEPAQLPASSLVTTNLDNTRTTFQRMSFSGQEPALPQTFDIVQATVTDMSSELLSNLATAFSLVAKPGSKTLYTGPEYYLSISNDDEWVLSKNTVDPPGDMVIPSQALPAATAFTNEHLPNVALKPYQPSIEYFIADETHYTESSEIDANLISIPMTAIIGEYPVFITNQSVFPVTYNLTSNSEIVRAIFNPNQIQLGAVTTALEPISITEAVGNINDDKGSIVYSSQYEFGEMDLTQVVDGTLTEVAIEYRIDVELGLAYPFYRFTGTAENGEGVELQLEIVTPAVATRD